MFFVISVSGVRPFQRFLTPSQENEMLDIVIDVSKELFFEMTDKDIPDYQFNDDTNEYMSYLDALVDMKNFFSLQLLKSQCETVFEYSKEVA